MTIIKNNVSTDAKDMFAYPKEDFVFRSNNGIKFFVSNVGHVFEAVRRVTNFAPNTSFSWEGKSDYVSDKEWE